MGITSQISHLSISTGYRCLYALAICIEYRTRRKLHSSRETTWAKVPYMSDKFPKHTLGRSPCGISSLWMHNTGNKTVTFIRGCKGHSHTALFTRDQQRGEFLSQAKHPRVATNLSNAKIIKIGTKNQNQPYQTWGSRMLVTTFEQANGWGNHNL